MIQVHKENVRQTLQFVVYCDLQTCQVSDKLKFDGYSANHVSFALPNYNDLAANLLGNRTQSGIKRRKFVGTAGYTFQRHGGLELSVNPRVALPSKLMTPN